MTGVVDALIISRLLDLYGWNPGYDRLTLESLNDYEPVTDYVDEWSRPCDGACLTAWDFGRVRFFCDEIRAGREFDPIEVDNRCCGPCIYPEPIVVDGHHRLVATKLCGIETIRAYYSGRVDLLEYLTGERSEAPSE